MVADCSPYKINNQYWITIAGACVVLGGLLRGITVHAYGAPRRAAQDGTGPKNHHVRSQTSEHCLPSTMAC